MAEPNSETEVVLGAPTDLQLSFRLHRFGSLDPTFRLGARRLLQAIPTPDGPGVLDIQALDGDGPRARAFRVCGHGPGGPHLVARAPLILGADDAPEHFVPVCGTGRRLIRSAPGLRLTRAASPVGMLISLVFQQRVAWRDAAQAHLRLVRRYGTAAPGDFGLVLPPNGKGWASIPLTDFSALDMDRRRAETIRRVGQVAGHVDRFFDTDSEVVARKLATISGLGPWTIQNFLGFALADADALPTGDYDLPHRVAQAFTGRARSTDEEMVRILEPYRGQRWRIVRLIEESGVRLQRFGPRRGSGRPQRGRGSP